MLFDFTARLQAELLHQRLENEDEILIAIAGIKQVGKDTYGIQPNIRTFSYKCTLSA